ncbi:hypothetical protein HY491_04770 [Candidatus Woesearchaeota archaeon]|nr:hypothetical protein [Candidatus Woesearchaeota archaeon]
MVRASVQLAETIKSLIGDAAELDSLPQERRQDLEAMVKVLSSSIESCKQILGRIAPAVMEEITLFRDFIACMDNQYSHFALLEKQLREDQDTPAEERPTIASVFRNIQRREVLVTEKDREKYQRAAQSIITFPSRNPQEVIITVDEYIITSIAGRNGGKRFYTLWLNDLNDHGAYAHIALTPRRVLDQQAAEYALMSTMWERAARYGDNPPVSEDETSLLKPVQTGILRFWRMHPNTVYGRRGPYTGKEPFSHAGVFTYADPNAELRRHLGILAKDKFSRTLFNEKYGAWTIDPRWITADSLKTGLDEVEQILHAKNIRMWRVQEGEVYLTEVKFLQEGD